MNDALIRERTPEVIRPASSWTIRTGARLGYLRSVVAVGAVVLGVRYVAWVGAIAPLTVLGVLFVVAQAVSLLLFTLTVASLLDRGRRSAPGAPTGTLDVFVTVCGESAAVVETALRTALAVEYPHRTFLLNDGRLAGDPNWQEIDELGRRLDVEVITRTNGGRCKAANLNNALAHSTAEFVATIDADHSVEPDLGHRMLRWFNNDEVAFVTARQRFTSGTSLLNSGDPFFYDVIQPAKDASGQAISCGSGVVYRRSALDAIGGFSEWNLVEDLHTSYRLHGAGWRSVYERVPVTQGDAPSTAAEHAHQRARWAIDSLRLLVFDCPLLRRGLSARTRLHYLQTTTSYVQSIPLVVYLAGPPLYLLLRVPVTGGSSTAEYIGHWLPYFGLLLLLLATTIGPLRALRTFRGTMFNDSVTAVAIVRRLTGRAPSLVTRKRSQRRATWLLFPQLVAVAILVGAMLVAVGDRRSGSSTIAVAWSAILALLLVGPLTAVSERRSVVRCVSVGVHGFVLGLGAVAVVVTVVVGQIPWRAVDPTMSSADFVVDAPRAPDVAPTTAAAPESTIAAGQRTAVTSSTTSAARPTDTTAAQASPARSVAAPSPPPPVKTKLAAPATGSYLGVSALGLPDRDVDLAAWSASHAGAQPAIVNWFQQWGSGENRFRADWVHEVAASGAIPMITWEPWAKPDNSYTDPTQSSYRLEAIIAGEFDEYIRAWAAAAAAHQGPILLRFMHEFNGNWYPWSIGQQDQTPAQFVAAWRYVHGIFVAAGATNVSWIWSIVADYEDPLPAYPGDDVVDWVGGTSLNFDEPWYNGWHDFGFYTQELYPQLLPYHKPIMYSELGTDHLDGDAGEWIGDMFDTIEQTQPEVRAVVLFDMPYDSTTDFTLSHEAIERVAAAAAGGWFAPPVQLVPA